MTTKQRKPRECIECEKPENLYFYVDVRGIPFPIRYHEKCAERYAKSEGTSLLKVWENKNANI